MLYGPKDAASSAINTKHTITLSAECTSLIVQPVGAPSNQQALTLRRLMSYIYMEHPFLMFLDHTQRRSTVGRTPLDE